MVKRKLFIKPFWIVFGLLLFDQASAKKNILFLMADDLNDWVGVYGRHPQAKTPNIDRLAKKGTIFYNAHCATPVCLPSRTALFTGLRPTTTNIRRNEDGDFRLRPELKNRITLPQFYKNLGYFAKARGKLFHRDQNFQDDPQSWSEIALTMSPHTSEPKGWVSSGAAIPFGANPDESTEQTGDGINAQVIADLLAKKQDKPFFLAYGSHKPHDPWFAPKKYFDMFPEASIILPEVLATDLDDVFGASNNKHDQFIKTGTFKKGVQAYLATINFVDDLMGKVLDSLENGPNKDSTIIFFMGDHGWHLGQKNHWGKATGWEESTATPLIIYDPTIKGGTVSHHVVSLQDVFRTALELTGNTYPDKLEGRSLVNLLRNPNDPSFKGWALSSLNMHTYRTTKWALIRMSSAQGNFVPGEAYKYELYNMIADPLQHINLAKKAEYKDIIAKLSEDIDSIMAYNHPVNYSLHGEPPVNIQKSAYYKKFGSVLENHKLYELSAYDFNGASLNTFIGYGNNIKLMIANPRNLDLGNSNPVFRTREYYGDVKKKLISNKKL